MAKKTVQQRLTSLNNMISEEQRVIATRTTELYNAYIRGQTLLTESMQEDFEAQFGEPYRDAMSGLDASVEFLSTLTLPDDVDDESLDSVLTYTRGKINEIQGVRAASKTLRENITWFMSEHRNQSTEMNVADVIRGLKYDVQRLENAIENREAGTLVREIEMALEAVEPLLQVPDNSDEFDALPNDEQHQLYVLVSGYGEQIKAVDDLECRTREERSHRAEQTIVQLFNRGTDLIKQKIEALYADDEVEHDLGLGYWLARSHELNSIFEDSDYYDGRDPQSILNNLTNCVSQIESEDRL